MAEIFGEERAIADLKANAENYRSHPSEQIEHIKESLQRLGQFKNVVIAPDGRILAGHGVVQAAEELGWETIIIHIFDGSEDEERLLMVADNEVARTSEDDARQLSELLDELNDGIGLEGTGYDEQQFANLLYTTRDEAEIEDFDAATEWVGMPEYDASANPRAQGTKLTVQFETEEARDDFAELLGIKLTSKTSAIWWPQKDNDKPGDYIFEDDSE